MKEKFLDLMKNEGLKSSQLAEILEVNPAGISHIIAGRNKPGYDLLQKILRRFPRINPDWLILDSGPMYRSKYTNSIEASSEQLSAITPKSESSQQTPSKSRNENLGGSVVSHDNAPSTSSSTGNAFQTAISEMALDTNDRQAIRVIICYDNHTFESFSLTPPTIR